MLNKLICGALNICHKGTIRNSYFLRSFDIKSWSLLSVRIYRR